MRTGELECRHGVGHSAGIHGCDGCCGAMMREAMANAWEEGYNFEGKFHENPYRQGENK